MLTSADWAKVTRTEMDKKKLKAVFFMREESGVLFKILQYNLKLKKVNIFYNLGRIPFLKAV